MPRNNRGVLAEPPEGLVNEYEMKARDTAEQAVLSSVSEVSSASDVHTRQLLPSYDLDQGSVTDSWDGSTREWVQGFLSDGENHTYAVDSNANAEKKVISIFAISAAVGEDGAPNTTQVQFETGNGAVIERANIEGLLTEPEDIVVFSDPLVFDADQDAEIMQYATGTGTDEEDNLIFHGVVAEKAGRTLEDSSRFLSEQ